MVTALIGSTVLLLTLLYAYSTETEIIWALCSVLAAIQLVALVPIATRQTFCLARLGRWLRISAMAWCVFSALSVILLMLERFSNHGFLGLSREPFLESTARFGLTAGDLAFTLLVVVTETLSFAVLRTKTF